MGVSGMRKGHNFVAYQGSRFRIRHWEPLMKTEESQTWKWRLVILHVEAMQLQVQFEIDCINTCYFQTF